MISREIGCIEKWFYLVSDTYFHQNMQIRLIRIWPKTLIFGIFEAIICQWKVVKMCKDGYKWCQIIFNGLRLSNWSYLWGFQSYFPKSTFFPPLIRVKSHVFFKARRPNPVEISNQQHSSPKKSRVAALVGLKWSSVWRRLEKKWWWPSW